jgi:hypothetical protein
MALYRPDQDGRATCNRSAAAAQARDLHSSVTLQLHHITPQVRDLPREHRPRRDAVLRARALDDALLLPLPRAALRGRRSKTTLERGERWGCRVVS